jgi:serine/threonine protein kinase
MTPARNNPSFRIGTTNSRTLLAHLAHRPILKTVIRCEQGYMMGIQNLRGQTLGQYELRELLGIGGMGAVYRGYQANLKREVAVKVLTPELARQ